MTNDGFNSTVNYMSGTFLLVHSWAGRWAASCGLGLPEDTQSNNKYAGERQKQSGLEQKDGTVASAEGLA